MTAEKKGLPFTIDHRRMFEKTIESRSSSPFQDIEETTRLALENASSYVSITERSDGFSIEFDGGGVDSQEGLIGLVRDLYRDNRKYMGRLGTAVASALSNKPDSISLTTPCEEGGSLRLKIEGMEPCVEPLDEKVDRTQFQIQRENRKPNEQGEYDKGTGGVDFAAPFKFLTRALVHPKKAWDSVFRSKRDFHKSKFEEVTRYSDLDITYNGETLRTGLFQEHAVFQATYTFDDAVVNVGVSNPDREKKVAFLRNGIKIAEDAYERFIGERSDFSTPDILIESSHFSTNISNELVRDEAFDNTVPRVKEAIKAFHADYLTGKLSTRGPSSSVMSKEDKIRFESDTLYNLLGSKDARDALNNRIRGEGTRDDGFGFLDYPVLEDIWKEYNSLAQAYKKIRENNFTYYITHGTLDPKHPAVKLERGAPAFHLNNSSQERLLNQLINEIKRNEVSLSEYSVSEGHIPPDRSPKRVNLGDLVMKYDSKKWVEKKEHEEKKEKERLEKRRRKEEKIAPIKDAVGRGAAAGAKFLGGCTACVGGVYALPYAISAAEWTTLLAIANPVTAASPFLAAGAGYGIYHSMPYVKRGVGKSLNVIGGGIGSTVDAAKNALPERTDPFEDSAVEKVHRQGYEKNTKSYKGDADPILEKPNPGPLRYATEAEKEYFEKLIRTLSTGILGYSLETLYNATDFRARAHGRYETDLPNIVSRRMNERRAFHNSEDIKLEGYHILDVSSTEFRKCAERVKHHGEGYIYKDIENILMKLSSQVTFYSDALLATMYRDTVDSVFNEFKEDSVRFRHLFPGMPSAAREYVLRRVLQEGASGPHDTWLEENYPYEIEQAAHHVMGETYVSTYTKLLTERKVGWKPCRQAYLTLTPMEIEGILEKKGPAEGFYSHVGIDDVLNRFTKASDGGDAVARLFPIISSAFVLRKKKEWLDSTIDQYIEAGDHEKPSGSWEPGSLEYGYLEARNLAMLWGDEKGADDVDDSGERITHPMGKISKARDLDSVLFAFKSLEKPVSLMRGIESPPPPISIANDLLTHHMLQHAGQADHFKGQMRDYFLHHQAYIMYSAIQEAYPDVVTNR